MYIKHFYFYVLHDFIISNENLPHVISQNKIKVPKNEVYLVKHYKISYKNTYTKNYNTE